jgi:uroporphyrinogen-III synthase
MSRPLEGRTIALAEGRQLQELAEMLEKEGAIALCYPMVSILDTPDPVPVAAWLRELIAGQFDIVILMTGEGLRRLLAVAAREGTREAAIAALAQTTTLTRGPKPVRALKEVALSPTHVAESPTTAGVIATLKQRTLAGLTIGVQLYDDANPELVRFLEGAGANVRVVQPYVYAPAADADRVANLVERAGAGEVDLIVFTSSPQVDRLYEVIGERGLQDLWQRALTRAKIAAVGPVVADNLRHRGARVDICPEQGFVMKNLVTQIKRAMGGNSSWN